MISSEVKKISEEILAALHHERQAILTRPSKLSSRCFDGRLLSGRAGAYTYRFALENDLELAAGLPVLLLASERCTRGQIQTMKGSEVQVVVEEHLGEEVAAGDLLVLENLLIEQLIKLVEQTRDGKREFFSEAPLKRVFGLVAPEIAEAEEIEIPPAEKELLNPDQLKAIRLGSASNLLLLCGPSGTGKTRTIAALAAHLTTMGERVLLVSHSPSGCDRALDQFYATLSQTGGEPPEGSVLRLGPADELSEATEAAVSLYPVAENSLPEVLRPTTLLGLRAAHRQKLEQIRKELQPIELRSTTSKVLQGAESAIAAIQAEAEDFAGVAEAIEAEIAANESKKAPAIQFLGEWQASPALERCRRQMLSALKNEGAKLPFPDDLAPTGLDEAQPEDDVTALLTHAKELAHAYPACKPAVETIELLKRQMDVIQKALPVARILHRAAENNLLADSLVIGTTVTRGCLSPTVFDGQFDSVIIDEAHRVSIPALYALAGLAKSRIILAGDFRMPPHSSRTSEVLPACRKAWAQDIFDWSGVRAAVDEGKAVPGLVFLDKHYRAYPDLTPWQGEFFYGRKIKDGAKERPAAAASEVRWAKGPVALVDTSGLEPWTGKAPGRPSRFNVFHAAAVPHLVNDLLDGGTDPEEIAVVVPGEAQLKSIQKLLWHDNLTSILVATLQQFQNTDREVVIFDLPDGPPHEVTHNLGMQEADLARRLLHVPMARARRQSIFLGNLPYLQSKVGAQSTLGRLLQKIQSTAPAVPLAEVLKSTPEVLKAWCDLAPAGYSSERFLQDIAETTGDLYLWGPVMDLPSVKRIGEMLSRGKEARTAYLFTSGRIMRNATGEVLPPQEFSRLLFGHAALPNVRFVLTTNDIGHLALLGKSVLWATTASVLDERVRRMGYARVEAPELGEEVHRMFLVHEMLARMAKLHERMALPTCPTCKEPIRLGAVEGQLHAYCACATEENWKTQELALTLASVGAVCPRCSGDLVPDAAGMRCENAPCGFHVGKGKAAPVAAKPKRKPPVKKKAPATETPSTPAAPEPKDAEVAEAETESSGG